VRKWKKKNGCTVRLSGRIGLAKAPGKLGRGGVAKERRKGETGGVRVHKGHVFLKRRLRHKKKDGEEKSKPWREGQGVAKARGKRKVMRGIKSRSCSRPEKTRVRRIIKNVFGREKKS